jgi:hypothetical protein
MKQRALIIKRETYGDNVNELNQLLSEGWYLIQMCPMPSAGAGESMVIMYPTCLVVLEKEDAPEVGLFDVTPAQLNSICLSYRHDFGLMPEDRKEEIRLQAREWLRSIRSELEHRKL